LTATNGVAVVDKVLNAWAEADRQGVTRPGRDRLIEITGESEYHVRKALDKLKERELQKQEALEDLAGTYPASSSSAVTSDSEPSPATTEHERELGPTAPDMIEPETPGSPAEPAEFTRTPPGSPAGDPGSPAGAPAPAPFARLWAWAGFAFGAVMSIAGNVLYTWIPPETAPETWTPGLAPQIGAAVWSVGLLISVEVLSRAAWRQGTLFGLARYVGAVVVALGSAVISYGHLKGVLLHWGYNDLQAAVGPLVLDGLMLLSGFAMLSMSSHQQRQDHRAGDLQ
jgi:Protein of unknown function (DUF2637)